MKQVGLKAEGNSLQTFYLSNCNRRLRDTQNSSWLTHSLIHYSYYAHREEQPELRSLLSRFFCRPPPPSPIPKETRTSSIFKQKNQDSQKGFWGHPAGPRHRYQQKVGFSVTSSAFKTWLFPTASPGSLTSRSHPPPETAGQRATCPSARLTNVALSH